jgi:hypothetical protein
MLLPIGGVGDRWKRHRGKADGPWMVQIVKKGTGISAFLRDDNGAFNHRPPILPWQAVQKRVAGQMVELKPKTVERRGS